MPTPSPTPLGVGVSALAQAYLVPIAGFGYVALPPEVEQEAVSGFQTGEVQQALRGYALSSVTQDDVGQAIVMVLDMEPSYMALPGTMDGFITGVVGTSDTTVTNVTLAGHPTYQMEMASLHWVIWQGGPLIVAVFGVDAAATTGVATALIEAHS
ncbi:MAG TPA: hypothetical protein VJA85_00095 [Candidatus Limnocylindria bacterium]|nr:hypothetical protein [Candidatus Limnocylindria bacterium]